MIYIPVAEDEEFDDREGYHINRMPRLDNHIESIAVNRREIFKKFLATDEKYLKMQDKHITAEYEEAERFLDENTDWGGVGLFAGKRLPPRLEMRHIIFDCVCIRREALKNIKLDTTNGGCTCGIFCREIRENWRYGYLNKLGLAKANNVRVR